MGWLPLAPEHHDVDLWCLPNLYYMCQILLIFWIKMSPFFNSYTNDILYNKQFPDAVGIYTSLSQQSWNCPIPNTPPNQRWHPLAHSRLDILFTYPIPQFLPPSSLTIPTKPLYTTTCHPNPMLSCNSAICFDQHHSTLLPLPVFSGNHTINPLLYGQPQSHTTLPVPNRHPQPHTTHPIHIYSRQRKPLYMKVIVIRCREKCKILNLKINGGHSSGMSYNKFLFNDFSFPFVQLQYFSVRNEFFFFWVLKRPSPSDSCTCKLSGHYPSQVTCLSHMRLLSCIVVTLH